MVRLFYHEDYFFPLPAGHPFQMEKFPRCRDLLRADGLKIEDAEPAGEEDLLRVHARDYLRKVQRGLWTRVEQTRMGLPVDSRLFGRCASETGGTIRAARAALLEGSIAANLGGGTHHAASDRAAGFCVFNDVAVAIRAIRMEHPDLYVMVIDTDAHQGDGTNEIFRKDPRTFTYSIHVGANYPASKVAGDCDVALDRYVTGSVYLDALRSSLEVSFMDFEPDLVFWVAGADIHEDDRFGQMCLNEDEIRERNRFVLEMVRGWSVPLAIVYGGGYNRDVPLTNRLHILPVRQCMERFG